jgi:hypothetical protein
MRKARAAVLGLLVAVMLASPASLATAATPRATGGAFARIDVGARILGMGGVGVVAEQGAFASHWNAANLAYLADTEVAVDYTDLFGLGIARHAAVAVAWRRIPTRRILDDEGRVSTVPRGRQLGFGVDLALTTVDLEPETYTEFSPAFSFAGAPWNGVAAGGRIRILRASSDLDDVSSYGYALELGFAVERFTPWIAAAQFRNLISSVAWSDDTSDHLPVALDVGLGYEILPSLLLAASATTSEDFAPLERAHLGGEWDLDPIALRAGITVHEDRGEDAFGLSLGAGARLRGLHLDYAFVGQDDTLDPTQRISLRLIF